MLAGWLAGPPRSPEGRQAGRKRSARIAWDWHWQWQWQWQWQQGSISAVPQPAFVVVAPGACPSRGRAGDQAAHAHHARLFGAPSTGPRANHGRARAHSEIGLRTQRSRSTELLFANGRRLRPSPTATPLSCCCLGACPLPVARCPLLAARCSVLLWPTLSSRVGNPCHLLGQAADAASIGPSHQSPKPAAALGMPVHARAKSNHGLCWQSPLDLWPAKPLVAVTGHVQRCQMHGAPVHPSSSTRAEQWAARSLADWAMAPKACFPSLPCPPSHWPAPPSMLPTYLLCLLPSPVQQPSRVTVRRFITKVL